MQRKKVSTTVYLEPEAMDSLRKLSDRTRVPYAELIRYAIDRALPQWQAEAKAGKAITLGTKVGG